MNFQCKSSFKWTLMVVVFTRNNANFGTRNANRVFPRGQNMGSPRLSYRPMVERQ